MDFVRFVNYDYQYIHTYICMYMIYKVIYLNVCYHYCLLFVGEISFTFDPYSVFEKRRKRNLNLNIFKISRSFSLLSFTATVSLRFGWLCDFIWGVWLLDKKWHVYLQMKNSHYIVPYFWFDTWKNTISLGANNKEI